MRTSKRKAACLLMLLVLSSFTFLCVDGSALVSAVTGKVEQTPPLAGNVTVHFIDVGQGDAIFVDTPGLDMLVDGGSRGAGEIVVGYLQSLNVTRIDFVVATHPHADHIGGLITVLTEYNTTQIPVVVDNGLEATTATYADYVSAVGARSTQVAVRGDTISLGHGVEVTILNPSSPHEFEDANDNSVVVARAHGRDSTVLKVGHHGSRTSTSTEYLDAVSPEIAVISVGEGNRYDHPHQETLDKLTLEGSALYRTDLHGTVRVTTDGSDYTVLIEKGSHPSPTTPEPDPESGPTPESPPRIPGFTSFQILLGALVAVIILMSKRNA